MYRSDGPAGSRLFSNRYSRPVWYVSVPFRVARQHAGVFAAATVLGMIPTARETLTTEVKVETPCKIWLITLDGGKRKYRLYNGFPAHDVKLTVAIFCITTRPDYVALAVPRREHV